MVSHREDNKPRLQIIYVINVDCIATSSTIYFSARRWVCQAVYYLLLFDCVYIFDLCNYACVEVIVKKGKFLSESISPSSHCKL